MKALIGKYSLNKTSGLADEDQAKKLKNKIHLPISRIKITEEEKESLVELFTKIKDEDMVSYFLFLMYADHLL